MAAMVAVNVLLPRDAVEALDAARGWEPRSAYLRRVLEDWGARPRKHRFAAPEGASPVLVTLLLPSSLVERVDVVRGGEPRSSFVRRLLLGFLQKPHPLPRVMPRRKR